MVLAYDCTCTASFDNVVAWMRGLVSALGDAGAAEVTKALVATKCDAPQERRAIATAQGEALAAAHGMQHYETSAKVRNHYEQARCLYNPDGECARATDWMGR